MRRPLVLRAYGHVVELVADDDLLDVARERLPATYRPGRGRVERSWSVAPDGGAWCAGADGEHIGARPDADTALDMALSDMELWIAEHAIGLVFLHAGCVAVDGRAIVLPGLSRCGKTTLVASLARAGAEYYSDEFAPIDRLGRVRAYSRPLSIRRGAVGVERMWPAELGSPIGDGPARVSLVALLRYDEASGWEVRQVSRARAILGLLDNTVPAQTRPVESLNAMERATRGVTAISGTRGDADQAATILLETISS